MNLLNQWVTHSTLGEGVIIAQDDMYITVEFPSKTSRFQYPDQNTFAKFLKAKDPAVQDALLQEIADKQREAEEKEAAKREAEERARAEEQARKEAEAAVRKAEKDPPSKTERISGKPLTFYVFQGGTYDIERRGGFIWAPKYGNDGRSLFFWKNLTQVKKGDVIGQLVFQKFLVADGDKAEGQRLGGFGSTSI